MGGVRAYYSHPQTPPLHPWEDAYTDYRNLTSGKDMVFALYFDGIRHLFGVMGGGDSHLPPLGQEYLHQKQRVPLGEIMPGFALLIKTLVAVKMHDVLHVLQT